MLLKVKFIMIFILIVGNWRSIFTIIEIISIDGFREKIMIYKVYLYFVWFSSDKYINNKLITNLKLLRLKLDH